MQAVLAPQKAASYWPSEPWQIGDLTLHPQGPETTVTMSGYAFPAIPPDLNPPHPFLLNGKPFTYITYPIYQEEFGRLFWGRSNAAHYGFACSVTVPTGDLYPNGAMELTFVNPGPVRRIPAQQSWFCCDPALELPLPDKDQRFRVIGTQNANHFTLGGFTDFKRLEAALRFFTGKGFADSGPILDFGCGCGRVARYVSQLNPGALTGFDIDSDNVAWCASNLPGRFLPSSVRPPVSLTANSFHVAYGISLFTHMRKNMQDAWLAELSRLCAPGAILLMTVHGQTALNYALQGPDVFRQIEQNIRLHGLYISDSNHQIDHFAEHEGEYVNVFHDPAYIENHWSEFFELLAILPGYIYTHDLVVMRKRSRLSNLWHKFRHSGKRGS